MSSAPMPAATRLIREASTADAHALADLLAQLGYATEPEELVRRLLAHRDAGGIALVAELTDRAVVVALATMSVLPAIHVAGRIAHVTAFVVSQRDRRQGIGRALLHALEIRARALGCVRLLVTSGTHRADAHRFYESAGLPRTGVRFARPL